MDWWTEVNSRFVMICWHCMTLRCCLNAFSLAVSSQWAKLSSWLCGPYQTSVLGEVPHGQEIMFGQVCLFSHVLTEALPCHHFFYCLSGLLSSCSDYLSLFGATIPTFCRWVAPVWKPKAHAVRVHWVHRAQGFGVSIFQHTRIPHIHLVTDLVTLVYILCLNDLKCVLAASFELPRVWSTCWKDLMVSRDLLNLLQQL
jgi:hypothetical protein